MNYREIKWWIGTVIETLGDVLIIIAAFKIHIAVGLFLLGIFLGLVGSGVSNGKLP